VYNGISKELLLDFLGSPSGKASNLFVCSAELLGPEPQYYNMLKIPWRKFS
jgi:hypothetical protein